MATIRQRSSGNWEIIIRRKGLLAKPHSATADSEALAHAYAKRIETFLDQGIIPVELQKSAGPENKTVWDWAKIYFAANSISSSDKKLLNQLCTMMQSWPISDINHDWADNWIDHMKRVDNSTPITIRHKVGAVARLLDWCLRKELINKNPLRNLPTKYSNYAENDSEFFVIELFMLQTAKKTFRRRIIPAIAFPTHALLHAHHRKMLPVFPAGILAATIRVMQ